MLRSACEQAQTVILNTSWFTTSFIRPHLYLQRNSIVSFILFNIQGSSSTLKYQCVLQCQSKKSPLKYFGIFYQTVENFSPNFTSLLNVPIYARLQSFISLSATLTKLCHIKCDHPVHIICAKCPPSAKRTLTFSDIFPKQLGTF